MVSTVGKAWVKARKRDPYYRKAKARGYRSRAAYKLLQIQNRFHVIRRGDTVIDLGAAPGGWSQVARELGASRVLAVDRAFMEPLEGVSFLKVDVGNDSALSSIATEAATGAHVVLSDMAPRLSGTRSLDHARSVDLAERALAIAGGTLREGGRFVTKVFQGDMFPSFLRRVQARFARSKGFSPPASPRGSAEIYIVAQGWQGPGTP
ncbi:MAG: RlmE family RNA methyltransferase [Candidatus Thermoplasmatota archaeon]|nr:RlmE family RNA methyltransferase [Candidatus Thermoplasmatota archaeon]